MTFLKNLAITDSEISAEKSMGFRLPEATSPSEASFVETPIKTIPAAVAPVAMIRSCMLNSEVSNDISNSLLCRLPQEVLHI